MKHVINWKIFSILLCVSLVSVLCVLPYILTLQGDLIRSIGVPLEILFVAQLLQTLVLFSVAIFLGLFFAERIGLQLPVLGALATKGDPKRVLADIAGISLLLGAGVAVMIYALDALFSVLGVTISTHASYAPAWQTLLAAVYGGATEEILMRLFLMSFFIWVGMKLFRRRTPSRTSIVVSIVLAAVIFGLGHLPITASLTTLNALVVSRAIVLNGIGGIVFGWLFWKKGLESAMIAHFTTEVVLLTLLQLLVP